MVFVEQLQGKNIKKRMSNQDVVLSLQHVSF